MLDSNQLPLDFQSNCVCCKDPKTGAGYRVRTCDLLVGNQMLYQAELSTHYSFGTPGENRTPVSAFVAPYSYPLNYRGKIYNRLVCLQWELNPHGLIRSQIGDHRHAFCFAVTNLKLAP